jgi:hypothetical protein
VSVDVFGLQAPEVANTAGVHGRLPVTNIPQTRQNTSPESVVAHTWSETAAERQSFSLQEFMSKVSYQNENAPIPGTPGPVERVRDSISLIGRWRDQRDQNIVVQGMKKWDGVVVGVDEDSFTVELQPTNHQSTAVYADFEASLISATDLQTLAPGSVVYVTVRTIRDAIGRPSRTSAIRVARLGRWSAAELDGVRERAKARTARLASNIE